MLDRDDNMSSGSWPPTKEEVWDDYKDKEHDDLVSLAKSESIADFEAKSDDELRKILFEIEWKRIKILPPLY
jgi:hypothetical protein